MEKVLDLMRVAKRRVRQNKKYILYIPSTICVKNVRANSQGIRTHNCRDLPPFNLFLFSHCTRDRGVGMGMVMGMGFRLATLAFKQTHYVVGQILCIIARTSATGYTGTSITTATATSTATATATATPALDHKVMLINMRPGAIFLARIQAPGPWPWPRSQSHLAIAICHASCRLLPVACCSLLVALAHIRKCENN